MRVCYWNFNRGCQATCWQGGFLLVVANWFFDDDKSGGLGFNINELYASMDQKFSWTLNLGLWVAVRDKGVTLSLFEGGLMDFFFSRYSGKTKKKSWLNSKLKLKSGGRWKMRGKKREWNGWHKQRHMIEDKQQSRETMKRWPSTFGKRNVWLQPRLDLHGQEPWRRALQVCEFSKTDSKGWYL